MMMGHLEMALLALLLWCDDDGIIYNNWYFLCCLCKMSVQVLLAPLLDSAIWTTYVILEVGSLGQMLVKTLSRLEVQTFSSISPIKSNAIHFSCYRWNLKCSLRLVK
jgi:hypothetical protein